MSLATRLNLHMMLARVTGRMAIGYHRTHTLETVNKMGESGFIAGDGAMYGRGIYLTYDFDSQLNQNMIDTYGKYVVRCKVALHNFLIFEPDVAKQVYGPQWTLEDQFTRFKLSDYGIYGINKGKNTAHTFFDNFIKPNYTDSGQPKDYSSSYALKVFETLFSKDSRLVDKHSIKGLVFRGRRDGRVIVAYDAANVVPFGVAEVTNNHVPLERIVWDKVTPQGAFKQRSILTNDDKAGSIARAVAEFFKRQGCIMFVRPDNSETITGWCLYPPTMTVIKFHANPSFNDITDTYDGPPVATISIRRFFDSTLPATMSNEEKVSYVKQQLGQGYKIYLNEVSKFYPPSVDEQFTVEGTNINVALSTEWRRILTQIKGVKSASTEDDLLAAYNFLKELILHPNKQESMIYDLPMSSNSVKIYYSANKRIRFILDEGVYTNVACNVSISLGPPIGLKTKDVTLSIDIDWGSNTSLDKERKELIYFLDNDFRKLYQLTTEEVYDLSIPSGLSAPLRTALEKQLARLLEYKERPDTF